MRYVDIIIETTVATTTVGGDPGAFALPGGFPSVQFVPTTQFVDGAGAISEIEVKQYWKGGNVRVNTQLVKYNVVKLHYVAVGDLVM